MPQLSKIDDSYLDEIDAAPLGWSKHKTAIPSIRESCSHDELEVVNVLNTQDLPRGEIEILQTRNKELEGSLISLQAAHEGLLGTHETLRAAVTDLQVKHIRSAKIEESYRAMFDQHRRLNVDHSALQLANSRLQEENAKLRQQTHQLQEQYQYQQAHHQRELEDLKSHFKQRRTPIPTEEDLEHSQPITFQDHSASTPETTDSSGPQTLVQDSRGYILSKEPSEKTGRKWLCSVCNKWYSRREHLRRHQRSFHTNDRPFNCDMCDQSYARKDHLTNHVRRFHSGVQAFNELERAALEGGNG